MALRINGLFNIREIPENVSYTNAPFYEYSVETIRLCVHLRNFPNLKSKCVYEKLLSISQPRIEIMYQTYDWKCIWKNISFKYIDIHDRSIVYKYLHEILPNKKILAQYHNSNPNCETCNVEESNIHMFLYCAKIQNCRSLLIRLIFYLCNMNVEHCILKCLFFDFPKVNKKVTNTLSIVISIYLAIIWFNRNSPDNLDYKLKARIKKSQKFHSKILQDKINALFTSNYSNIDTDIIDAL